MPLPPFRLVPGRSVLAAALIIAISALGLAACSSADVAESGSAGHAAAGDGSAGPILVVASTSVWGDIAAQVGGDRVDVTSLISDPSQDPHEFQPAGRDELAISRADIVIANGGGYDDFISQMLASTGADPVVITATDVAGAPDSGASIDPDNEHVWFSLDATAAVAHAIAAALSERDPDHGNEFRANVDAFGSALDPVRAQIDAIRQQDVGAHVIVTEPLPLYLVAAAGLVDATPKSFAEAMEEGIDVSPADLAALLRLIEGGEVRLLLYNEQTASAQVEQLLDAAEKSHVPVLPLEETLPTGQHYQDWMDHIVTDLRAGLEP